MNDQHEARSTLPIFFGIVTLLLAVVVFGIASRLGCCSSSPTDRCRQDFAACTLECGQDTACSTSCFKTLHACLTVTDVEGD